jgi:hypothetical protein
MKIKTARKVIYSKKDKDGNNIFVGKKRMTVDIII